MIENDETGERYFQYWRNDAAAKLMFGGWSVEKIADLLKEFNLVYFSGITLAILDDAQRDNLLAALGSLRGKVKVAFDPNFRPGPMARPRQMPCCFQQSCKRYRLCVGRQ